MPSFKKVLVKSEGEMSEKEKKQFEKKSQKEYNEKVEKLKGCVTEFTKNVAKREYTNIHLIKKDFENCFKDYIKSKKLFSRTNKIIKEMYKKIEKAGSIMFYQDTDLYCQYCFKFDIEKPKNGYIKRSAIDNPEVVNLFSNIENTFKAAFEKMREKSVNVICEFYEKNFPGILKNKKIDSFRDATEIINEFLISLIKYSAKFKDEFFYEYDSFSRWQEKLYKDLQKQYGNITDMTKKSIDEYINCLKEHFPHKEWVLIIYKDDRVLDVFEKIKNSVKKRLYMKVRPKSSRL